MTTSRGLPLRTTHALPLASTMLLGRPPTAMSLIAVFWAGGVVAVPVDAPVVVPAVPPPPPPPPPPTPSPPPAEGEGRDERQPSDRHHRERPGPPRPRARLARGEHRGRLVGGDDGLLAVAGGRLADRDHALGPRRTGLAGGRQRRATEVAGRRKAVLGILRHGPRQDRVEA